MDRSSILSSPDSTQGRRKHVCSSVSLSRNRGLGKGTAFESPSPANSVESLSSFPLFGVNPKGRHFIIRRFSVCQDYFRLADNSGVRFQAYLTGREPAMRISTNLLALSCQSGLVETLETPTRARSR